VGRTTRARVLALAATAGVAGGLLVAPSPASAVSYRHYFGSYSRTCMEVPQAGSTVVNLTQCSRGADNQEWSQTRVGTSGSGKPIMTIKNHRYGTCLDVNGTNALPAVKACNNGNDQRWEIFDHGNGVRTLKSWGAWVGRSRHTCLTNETQFRDAWLRKATCDASSAKHRWDD
jgi:hypothetical protein